jgi:2-polyprenyl-3-methyl-5-hydroxy-6-metoxy-1,4-benzoquinol methylase
MNKMKLNCPVCLESSFKKINKIYLSNWIRKKRLKRQEQKYQLISCNKCSHVFSVGDYSKKNYECLYPDSYTSTAIKTKNNIYKDIINFNEDYLLKSNNLSIIDFGGGDGSFLKQLNEYKKLVGRIRKLRIYDMNKQIDSSTNIKYVKADLNHINKLKIHSFSYGFCIHTLEHLIKPRLFLESIGRSVGSFYLYIEVPASNNMSLDSSITLVHPVHIHYFIPENLIRILTDCGYRLLRFDIDEVDGVDRMKALVRKSDRTRNFVVQYLEEDKKRLKFIYTLILKYLKEGSVGLWGIGKEFWDLIKHYPNLKRHVMTKNIVLIDANLAGSKFENKLINKGSEAVNKVKKVIILPRELFVIQSIKKMARKGGFKEKTIIDPYKIYSSL